MADEEGVLGNLPRSRPGRRSARRADKAADAAGTRRAAPKTAKPRAARANAGEKPLPPRPQASSSSSPVSGVLSAVTSLAGGGVRLAHGAARRVLRRLPRP